MRILINFSPNCVCFIKYLARNPKGKVAKTGRESDWPRNMLCTRRERSSSRITQFTKRYRPGKLLPVACKHKHEAFSRLLKYSKALCIERTTGIQNHLVQVKITDLEDSFQYSVLSYCHETQDSTSLSGLYCGTRDPVDNLQTIYKTYCLCVQYST